MLTTIRSLLSKTNNIERSAYIWNGVNAVIAALQSPLILMVIIRTNGVYDAGVFSIAFAIASLMLHVGMYGIRKFQVSDIKEIYSFSDYHATRIVTCTIMMIISILYCIYGVLFNDYTIDKFVIILMVCAIRCIQAYADVIHGKMQQRGRLDVAAKASTIRYIAEIGTYLIVLFITRDLLLSSIICVVISVIVLLLTTVNVSHDYCRLEIAFEISKIKKLMIEGFPIFVSLFLNMYISNAPKYAIDTYLTEEAQAVYNLIFMPAFMVGLLANFIFNPILTLYAEVWVNKEITRFKSLIKKQCVLIACITVLGLLVAMTIGSFLLSIIFGLDLTTYKLELCVIMIGGGMLAYSAFFSAIITIIRVHRALLFSYGAVALAALVFSGLAVTKYGIMGAAAIYAILITVLSMMLLVVMLYKIKKEEGFLTV